MSSYRTVKLVLIDLSGTLHIDNEVTPLAKEALQRLREHNVKLKFVTNTTKESRHILYERLINLGFNIDINEIWSSIWAARNAIVSDALKPFLLVDNKALEDFSGLDKFEGEPNAVVVGLAPERFHYDELNKAFRYLRPGTLTIPTYSEHWKLSETYLLNFSFMYPREVMNVRVDELSIEYCELLLLNGAKLIAIHEGRYYKRTDGLALGPGPFVKALEYAADCRPVVLGKPCPDFFRTGLGDTSPEDAVMIGDDVRDDIHGAQQLGIRGYLVKTGKYREGDENKIKPPPYKTLPNFAAAVEEILKEMNSQKS